MISRIFGQRRRIVATQTLLLVFLLLLATSNFCSGHESCCKHKLLLEQQQAQQEWIPDPNDEPPLIDKPDDVRPADWDSEDDGEWEPAQIPDPNHVRRLIKNPDYIPPPTFWDKLQTEILAALPWVTAGIIVTGLLSSAVGLLSSSGGGAGKSDLLSKLLLTDGGRLPSLLLASLLGLATPLCSCGALPLCVGLLQQSGGGVPLAQVLAFLTASQSAGLDSAAVTYGLLGGTALAARLLGAMVLSVSVGLACPITAAGGATATTSATNGSSSCRPTKAKTSSNQQSMFQLLINSCLETAVEVYPTVLMGLTLSTLAIHCLPSLTSYSTSSGLDFFGRLVLLAAAVPLQLCEHTAVTVAGAISRTGGSNGLAFAVLLSAPATNLSTILFVAKQSQQQQQSSKDSPGSSGVATAIRTTTMLVASALIISWIVDASGVDLLASESTGEMTELPSWWIESCPYIATIMLLVGYGRKYSNSNIGSSTSSSAGGVEDDEDNDDDCCGCGSSKTAKTATTTNGVNNNNGHNGKKKVS